MASADWEIVTTKGEIKPFNALLTGIAHGEVSFILSLYGSVYPKAIATATLSAQSLFIAPILIGLLPSYMIAKNIESQNKGYYGRKQFASFNTYCAYFLLGAAHAVFYSVLGLMLMSLVVTTINPFTLPFYIAAGVSGSIMMGLYLWSMPPKHSECELFAETSRRPKIASSSCLSAIRNRFIGFFGKAAENKFDRGDDMESEDYDPLGVSPQPGKGSWCPIL